ncbi:hypothetical protein FOXB_17095 [Fusarium oxysporum f. sp. conglutinans Fo5176]|uniref:Uncharacterized protein n=1 Tax=Fusarium oxysporum (strain Fo5176) TaxID=660025 RepID=F9GEL1_FUSOF|nr:hypothetical protein FOXB_17095 [Fusarium oxysporum f. sp. conglutinans Fo5176]
MDPNQKFI